MRDVREHPAVRRLRADCKYLEVAKSLRRRTDQDSSTARPTWEVIGADADCHRATVGRAIAFLGRHGLLGTVATGRSPGYGPASLKGEAEAAVYVLTAPRPLQVVPPVDQDEPTLPCPDPAGVAATALQQIRDTIATGCQARAEAAGYAPPRPPAPPVDEPERPYTREDFEAAVDAVTGGLAATPSLVEGSAVAVVLGFEKSTHHAHARQNPEGSRFAAQSEAASQRKCPTREQNVPLWHGSQTAKRRDERSLAARELQRRVPVLARTSTAWIASATREYFLAGWTILDVLHALDHGPDGAQWPHSGAEGVTKIGPWVAHRLSAWRDEHGTVGRSPSQRTTDETATRARARAAARTTTTGAAAEAAAPAISASLRQIRDTLAAQHRATLYRS